MGPSGTMLRLSVSGGTVVVVVVPSDSGVVVAPVVEPVVVVVVVVVAVAWFFVVMRRGIISVRAPSSNKEKRAEKSMQTYNKLKYLPAVVVV